MKTAIASQPENFLRKINKYTKSCDFVQAALIVDHIRIKMNESCEESQLQVNMS